MTLDEAFETIRRISVTNDQLRAELAAAKAQIENQVKIITYFSDQLARTRPEPTASER